MNIGNGLLRMFYLVTVLEITVSHWPFSDQFQHLADQISCTLSIGQQSVTYKISYLQINGRPISDPYF